MKIEIRHICKRFGKQTVISDLSMTVEDRAFIVILGPSGCGKTTLLRMIAGLEQPDSGEILFDGQPVFSKKGNIFVPPEKRDLGFVFQDMALWPHMTVWENVAFGLRMRKRKGDIAERVPEALKAVHMEKLAERYPHQLSGGQQQRAALARAVACTSRCILFDEPMSALDAVLRTEMRAELRRLVSEFHMTSVWVTHDQEEAMSLADEIAVLSDGVLQQCGAPRSVYETPATLFTASFIGKSNWIGENRMFRPESARRNGRPGDLSFPAEVTDVRYMGGYYEMSLLHGNTMWIIRTGHPEEKGSRMQVYVAQEDIIELTEGKIN